MNNPINIVVVGMGARSMIYAREALAHPDMLKIVGVVDINPQRVKLAQKTFKIPDSNCFSSVDALVSVPKFADAVINGTMDAQHVSTTIPLLRAGYDVLLEKPFAVNQQEGDLLIACERETGRHVMICHVLRYAPFYRGIKEILTRGEIGDIINIQMGEQVSFFHESVSYVRGKYALPEVCGSGMLLSKCSHDIDIMAWMMDKNHPNSVSSVGSVFQFKPEMAPDGAGAHCLVDCQVERECQYSARRLYLEHPQRWVNNVWHDSGLDNPSDEEKVHILSDSKNPFSRCVYRCDLQIVDHQSLLINFVDGATGTFSMNGGASASERSIHITGTRGEISGIFEEECFSVSTIAPQASCGRIKRTVDVSHMQKNDAHGCGDRAIVKDFVSLLRGETPSPCCTTLSDSMIGHKIVFLAEISREKGG
ncbi:MAG: Gfo/Idh/MocA family oxidoreductase, partial [Clostridia bacterium]